MKSKTKKLIRDPFMGLILLVVLVPALLVIYGISRQASTQSAVNSARQDVSAEESTQASSASTTEPTPITQAEQTEQQTRPTVEPESGAPEKPTNAAKPAGPVCDQAKKQAAVTARGAQLSKENRYHEQQKDRLRLVSMVTRKYIDEEISRHQAALDKINADYQAALAAANC